MDYPSNMMNLLAIATVFRRMPWGLRLTTFLCGMLIVFVPVALIPGGQYHIDDTTVDFTEFWRRGGGPAFISMGLLGALLAYGFLGARRWVRPLLVFILFLLSAMEALWAPTTADQLHLLVSTFLVTGLAYLYFFHHRPVIEFFTHPNNQT